MGYCGQYDKGERLRACRTDKGRTLPESRNMSKDREGGEMTQSLGRAAGNGTQFEDAVES